MFDRTVTASGLALVNERTVRRIIDGLIGASTGGPRVHRCDRCGTANWSAVCWRCRADENDRRRRRRDAVRKPPRPPFDRRPAGWCRMCGVAVTGRRITWCSDECALLWSACTSNVAALHLLVDVHGWRCWCCGRPSPVLEVDHVRPLWSLDEHERGELRWWLPFNLQLLDPACHRAKTRAEAAERAALRRTAAA